MITFFVSISFSFAKLKLWRVPRLHDQSRTIEQNELAELAALPEPPEDLCQYGGQVTR